MAKRKGEGGGIGGAGEGKVILDLCGGTGSWSKPYVDAGYTIYNITLPEFDVTAWCEAETEVEDGRWVPAIGFGKKLPPDEDGDTSCARDCQLIIPLEDIHGILAAPPCTEFSLAKANNPRDYVAGMETVRACLEIIWRCRTYGELKWWALENPVGMLRQFLGVPAYTFEPWQFGDPSKKRTDLWGYFNEPKKLRGATPPDYPRKGPGSWANKSKRLRAITPEKFVAAFCKANP